MFSRRRPLLPVGPPDSLGPAKLPGHSGIQLQVGDVLLDPGLTGVGTDLPASFGLEAVKSSGGVTLCGSGSSGPAHSLGAPLPVSVQRAAPTDSGSPAEDPAAASSFPPFPLGWACPHPDSASPWPGQATPQRPGSCMADRTSVPLGTAPSLPHPLYLPGVGRQTGTYMMPGLEHWLLVS